MKYKLPTVSIYMMTESGNVKKCTKTRDIIKNVLERMPVDVDIVVGDLVKLETDLFLRIIFYLVIVIWNQQKTGKKMLKEKLARTKIILLDIGLWTRKL